MFCVYGQSDFEGYHRTLTFVTKDHILRDWRNFNNIITSYCTIFNILYYYCSALSLGVNLWVVKVPNHFHIHPTWFCNSILPYVFYCVVCLKEHENHDFVIIT